MLHSIKSWEDQNMSSIIGLFQQGRNTFLAALDKLPDTDNNLDR